MRYLLAFLCSSALVTATEVRIEAEGTTGSEQIADGWVCGCVIATVQ